MSEDIVTKLKSVPMLLNYCDKLTIARLTPSIMEVSFHPGESLFTQNMEANTLYFIYSGKVKLCSTQQNLEIEHDFVGEEGLLGSKSYMSTAIAQEPITALSFTKKGMEELLQDNVKLKNQFHKNLTNKFLFKAEEESKPHINKTNEKTSIYIGWILSIMIPGIILFAFNQKLDATSLHFGVVFSSALIMWAFQLLPEYIPAIFIIISALVLELVPDEIILTGYTSSSFFMALSIFAIGAVLAQSGLAYRISLLIIRYIPAHPIFYNVALLLVGILLTPILPTANGRVSLLTPLLLNIVNILSCPYNSKRTFYVATATFSGLSLFSASFLTSKSINFVVFDSLPNQIQEQFTFSYWFFASSITFITLLISYIALSFLFGRSEPEKNPVLFSKNINKNIDLQLKVIGRMSLAEWIALIAIVTFVIGIMTSSIHKIQPAWVGFAILSGLLMISALTTKDFRGQIDWPFLLMLASFVGLGKIFSVLGIERWIVENLVWTGDIIRINFIYFTLLIAAVTFILRFVLPNNVSIMILVSVYMPIAIANGINPWLIVFIVLIFSDSWFLPYQCSYYQSFLELTQDKNLFNTKLFLKFNLWLNLARVVAVVVSIPFWKYLGLL